MFLLIAVVLIVSFVSGDEVPIEQYPYQISLMYHDSHICGGAIISEKFAITAAHCTDNLDINYASVRVGSTSGTDGQVVPLLKATPSPSFIIIYLEYDLAILEFETALTFGSKINKIELPALNENAPLRSAEVTGWGLLPDTVLPAENLERTSVSVKSKVACELTYGLGISGSSYLCVENENSHSCMADDGAPLVMNNKLIGIRSWGYGCARKEYQVIYTDVAAMRLFITDITGI